MTDRTPKQPIPYIPPPPPKYGTCRGGPCDGYAFESKRSDVVLALPWHPKMPEAVYVKEKRGKHYRFVGYAAATHRRD